MSARALAAGAALALAAGAVPERAGAGCVLPIIVGDGAAIAQATLALSQWREIVSLNAEVLLELVGMEETLGAGLQGALSRWGAPVGAGLAHALGGLEVGEGLGVSANVLSAGGMENVMGATGLGSVLGSATPLAEARVLAGELGGSFAQGFAPGSFAAAGGLGAALPQALIAGGGADGMLGDIGAGVGALGVAGGRLDDPRSAWMLPTLLQGPVMGTPRRAGTRDPGGSDALAG